MPGPCSHTRTKGVPTAPNKRSAKRLAARVAGFSASNDKYRAGYHVAGSQNRKK